MGGDRNNKGNTTEQYPHLSTKITIKQNPKDPKKMSLGIRRAIDEENAKEIIFERRFGEGAKPLFAREELQNKKSPKKSNTERTSYWKDSSSGSSHDNSDSNNFRKSNHQSRSSLPSNQTHTQAKERNSSSERSHRLTLYSRRADKSHSPKKKKSPDKVPYFLDAKREEDRIRRKYKEKSEAEPSTSKPRQRTKSRTPPLRRKRSITPPVRRNRSRTPPVRRNRSRSRTRSRDRSRRRTASHRRSYSRDRRHRDRRRSRSRSRDQRDYQSNIVPGNPYIPIVYEYPYHPAAAGWIPPHHPIFPRIPPPVVYRPYPPFPPPIHPYYLRQPYRPPPRFPPRLPRSNYRPRGRP